MRVSRDDFGEYLSRASFIEHGDDIERNYSGPVLQNFPLCEEFWANFVVPLTTRVKAYPRSLAPGIDFRPTTDYAVQDIANSHYSMFLNLVYAHRHLVDNDFSLLEDVYVHLAAACDLAESLIVKWFVLLSLCRSVSIPVLQDLSREDFIQLAKDWYDEHYSTLYEIYREQRRHPAVELPTTMNILVDYLGRPSDERKTYARVSVPIRTYRNIIVHDLKVARIITSQDGYLVPKSSKINQYRTWRSVEAVAGDQQTIGRDFNPIPTQCSQDLEALETALNGIWRILIRHFKEEFYSPSNNSLRRYFDIQFSDSGPTVVLDDSDQPSPHFGSTPSASGTYGGTADYSQH